MIASGSGWYCYWRTGDRVPVQDAFRLLTA